MCAQPTTETVPEMAVRWFNDLELIDRTEASADVEDFLIPPPSDMTFRTSDRRIIVFHETRPSDLGATAWMVADTIGQIAVRTGEIAAARFLLDTIVKMAEAARRYPAPAVRAVLGERRMDDGMKLTMVNVVFGSGTSVAAGYVASIEAGLVGSLLTHCGLDPELPTVAGRYRS